MTTHHVVRGGSWYYSPWFLRSAYRVRYVPDYRINYLGFRLIANGFRLIAEPKDPRIRVVCGGSWVRHPRFLRSADRNRNRPDFRDLNLGFRLIAEAKDSRYHVYRGGSWLYTPMDLRSAYRDGYHLDYRKNDLGVRLIAESKS